jgi:YHS domain-containing protein
MIPPAPAQTKPPLSPLDNRQEILYTLVDCLGEGASPVSAKRGGKIMKYAGWLVLPLMLIGALGSVSATAPKVVEALMGFDPVLLVEGKEVVGKDDLTVTREQFRYHFATPENKATFLKDPERYEIQMGGLCARLGESVPGNPDMYTLYEGRIYIVASSECLELFEATPTKYLEPEPHKPARTAHATKKAQELLQKAVEAVGGANRIDALTSYEVTGAVSNYSGDAQVKTTYTFVFPDHLRRERNIPDYGTIATVVVGDEAFQIRPDEVRPFSKAQRTNFVKMLKRNVVSLLRARKDPGFVAVATEPSELHGKRLENVAVDFNGLFVTLGIDPTTGRPSTLSYTGRGVNGDYGHLLQELSDFRTVDGLTLPFKVSTTFNGQPVPQMSFTAESIAINGDVPATIFEKPTD